MIDAPADESPPFVQLLPLVAEAGPHSLPMRHVAALEDAAEALDLLLSRIDLHGCLSKEEVLQRFAQALAFPEWFGHNWDALADALGDLDWLPEHDGYVLIIDGIAALRAADADAADRLIEIAQAVADAWRGIGVGFWTFLTEA